MPQPATNKENSFQTPPSPNDSEIQKRKLSPSSQSSTLSIDLKPRKKRTNSKRKNSV